MSELALPEGWMEAPLVNCLDKYSIISDGDWVETKDQDVDGSVRLIQLADIGDGFFRDKSNRFMNTEDASRLNCTYLKEGDVLVARMPDPLGRACIFPKLNQEAVTVVDVCLIRPSDESALSSNLLKFWINSPIIRNKIVMNATGTTRKRITRKKLEKFHFPVPPLAEQEQIKKLLNLHLTTVSQIQARLDAIPKLIEKFRQSVLNDAVSGELTGYKEFKEIPLKDLTSKIGSGSTPRGGKSAYKEEGIPLVRSMNIYTDYIKYKNLAFIDEEQASKLANVQIEEDDVLLNITGASIGRVNIAPANFIGGRVNQHVSIIRCKQDLINPKYLKLFLASDSTQRWVMNENYGATRQALTKTQIENYNIKTPALDEQNIIIEKVDNLLAFIEEINKSFATAKARVDNLTQSILHQAFTGNLTADWREQNPDLISGENSAEALLAKIKAEKQAKKAVKKK
ncbi:restriction endonuclease subunit S [uncultured Psychrobacter sp.]|uniref:restriction endonuclease subunit S n=1 Tax=uncultured Psychrobacter sp. TaxID=259303 RepID=UPI00345A907D